MGLALNVGSLVLRAQGRRPPAKVVSALGFLTSSVAAHIGGELSFGLGVRVNRTAWQRAPSDFVPVLDEAEVQGETLHRVEVEGTPVVVARSRAGDLCAIAATCTHFGGPLDQGTRDGDSVVCPWHGSRFDLCTGEVLDGPAVFPEPRFEVRVREGKIELRQM
jgi:nitrite reductase/ring-hydroxylating ferredoxin subunit